MTDVAEYSAIETARGQRVEIRAIRPDDDERLAEAVERASPQSLYRRFFGVRRFTDKDMASFSDVDFVNHVALVAVTEEGGRPVIVGGGRYVVVKPGQAEIAFALIDQYQGRGIGSTLMRHLVAIARTAGLKELVAEVLAENAPMLKVFRKCGLGMTTRREAEVVHVMLRLS